MYIWCSCCFVSFVRLANVAWASGLEVAWRRTTRSPYICHWGNKLTDHELIEKQFGKIPEYTVCSGDYAKRCFRPTTNSVSGKIGRITSKESVLQLIKGKCLSILSYGLEAYPLKKLILRNSILSWTVLFQLRFFSFSFTCENSYSSV